MRQLIVWITLVMVATLAPFNFSSPPRAAFQYGAFQQQADDVALNVVLFVPLGVLLSREGRGRSLSPSLVVAATLVGAGLLSASLEWAQAFLPVRDSSLVDVMANVAGAGLGLAAERRWGRPRSGRSRVGGPAQVERAVSRPQSAYQPGQSSSPRPSGHP